MFLDLFVSRCFLPAILCLCAGRLLVHPDRSHFFRYENVSFSCSDGRAGRATRVLRNTFRHSTPCDDGWGVADGAACVVEGLFTLDSGVYWCETDQSGASDRIDITVTSALVLLSVPVHPVLQGAPVSLACLSKERNGTEFEARFFKDGLFVGKVFPAVLTLSAVTPEHQGLYRCECPTGGSSRPVPLRVSNHSVRDTAWITETPPTQPITVSLLLFGLLFLLYTSIFCVGVCICRHLAKARAEAKRRGADACKLRRVANTGRPAVEF
ncbi:low affinity immunoglobulin gamma Fc region receptor III-A-like [Eucyclogobius newberryi]|uniref:low affinity immunoglobulin gamma Fc region receptor III-A-like n=1 Tax=Eucyclogobius newberryi TaxID=166745 RepID=UPI003B5AF561